ncbi:MAG: DUF11 domain-containing protein, partial [Actinobacteria bacterium]|nr:DUF11 domain-containing protein [Actinomycetota bacterium]
TNHSARRIFSAIAFLAVLGALGMPAAPAQQPDEETVGPSAAGERYLQERFGEVAPLPLPPQPLPAEEWLFPFELEVPLAGPYAMPPPFGTDIIANDPTDDTPENTTQSETSLAVLGDTLCAGYNNSGPGGLSGLSRSADLGNNWADLGGIGQSGDPVIAVDESSGDFFYAEIATIGGNPAIGVANSSDDCQNFAAPADASPVASGIANTTLNDKPWIAVDNTGGAGDGNVYACWTRFFCLEGPAANCSNNMDDDNDGQVDEGSSELRFSRSLDGGASFQNEQILQPGGTAPFGCSVDVGPGGEVYVAWADRVGATAGDIQFRSSMDQGQNFNPTATIATGNRRPGIDRVVTCGPSNRPTLNGNIRMLHQVWIAADTTGGPFDGNIYAVWASDPAGGVDNSDVLFSRSTDGGVMWDAPTQLGGGGGQTDQFEPFVEVAGAGAVSVAWYDRRNDATNNFNIDVFKAFSLDGGASFQPIVRVTDVTFPVPPILPNFDPGIAQCYMGEYIAIAGDDRNFYYLWGDNRNTLTTTNFPAGRPDPDVFFEAEAAPIVNEADLAVTKSDDVDPVVAGTQLVYDIMVENTGPDIALDVVVTDALPPEVGYVSDTAGCDTSALPTLTCNLGDFDSGDSDSFSVTVNVPADLVFNGITSIVDTAEVDGVANDPNAGNDVDEEETTVVAVADVEILSFGAVDPPEEVLVGEDVALTLRKQITNNGPSGPVDTQLTLTATAPAGSTVVPAVAVLSEPALGLGEVRAVDEEFTINCGAASQHTFEFDNEIEAIGATDPDLGNNEASALVDLECVVPVLINIKPGSDPNSIQPTRGTIAVAVLSTSAGEGGTPLSFDATTVNALSVRFGPREVVLAETGGAFERHGRG